MMKNSHQLFVFVMSLILTFSACDGFTQRSQEFPVDTEIIVNIDGISATVFDVLLRNSVQTHYLMSYPEPGQIYFEVILNIQGLDDPPPAVLKWGTENLSLNCDGKDAELVFPRREIADENVEYKIGEVINFNYIYIYSVSDNTDFKTCKLVFSDGQTIKLASKIQVSRSIDSIIQFEDKGVVLSGEENQAQGDNAVVAGGAQNVASAINTTVSGGMLNVAITSHATVAGGRENEASNFYASICGGYANTANARDTFVGGGSRNTASGSRSSIGGGIQNQATAPDTAIVGGAYNLATDDYAFVGGGTRNNATGFASVIAGGLGNVASNDQSTISGGLANKVESLYGTVGGGYANQVFGNYGTIPGGFENHVSGDFSFAAGRRAVISAEHSGTFIFADASEMEFPSTSENEFAVRATGGIRLITSVNENGESISGVQLPAGSGSWATLSDQSAKSGFKSINQKEILSLVANLPISTWYYRSQNESIKHIGPASQDFYAAFGFGEDEQTISMVDADGVSFAAIQGLFEIIQEQEERIRDQDNRLMEIETQLEDMERLVSTIQKPQPKFLILLGWGSFVGLIGICIGMMIQIYLSGLSRRKP
jgi:hypothetical protein